MENSKLLIVRNGEIQTNTGLTALSDPPLTSEGMRQSCIVASWLKFKFKHKGFYGMTSPSMSCLQTASVVSMATEIPFVVTPQLRDFTFGDEEIVLEDRSVPFQNLSWPVKDWDGVANRYPAESVEEFINRCVSLLYNIEESRYDKVLVVTHATPSIVLAELAGGKKPEQVSSDCEQIAKAEKHPKLVNALTTLERQIFLTASKPAGLTYVEDGKPIWFSRAVYEEE